MTGHKLMLHWATLPPATLNTPYTQDISSFASGGKKPSSFFLISIVGSNVWFVSESGVITGIPTAVF